MDATLAILLFGTFKSPFALIIAVSSFTSIVPSFIPTAFICSSVSEAIVCGASSCSASFFSVGCAVLVSLVQLLRNNMANTL